MARFVGIRVGGLIRLGEGPEKRKAKQGYFVLNGNQSSGCFISDNTDKSIRNKPENNPTIQWNFDHRRRGEADLTAKSRTNMVTFGSIQNQNWFLNSIVRL